MRVIETDNYGRDYPDEKFVSEVLPKKEAQAIADKLNDKDGMYSQRYYKVVEDDYELQPGFSE